MGNINKEKKKTSTKQSTVRISGCRGYHPLFYWPRVLDLIYGYPWEAAIMPLYDAIV